MTNPPNINHLKVNPYWSSFFISKSEENKTSEIVGCSTPMLNLYQKINNISEKNVNVLIRGESGTGKELVACALHQYGEKKRLSKRLFAQNCANFNRELLESDLFGHVRGAFTGATANKTGKMQVADGGNLFLDEIGDMSLELQSKLLRVIQEGEIHKVGEDERKEPQKVDVRFICATNQPLEEKIKQGTFREDLFYRINVYPIFVPALRERKEDIPALTKYFLNKHVLKHKLEEIQGLSSSAEKSLLSYDWPGNVRQLSNVIERAILDRQKGVITREDISFDGNNSNEKSNKKYINFNYVVSGNGNGSGNGDGNGNGDTKFSARNSTNFQNGNSKKWYEEGVIFLTFRELSEYKSIHSQERLLESVLSQEFFGLDYGTNANPQYGLIITQKELERLFDRKDKKVEEYILSRFKENHWKRFNSLIKEPFIVTSKRSLLEKTSNYLNPDYVSRSLRNIGPIFMTYPSHYSFLLNDEVIEHIYCTGNLNNFRGRESRINFGKEELKEKIREEHERFNMKKSRIKIKNPWILK